MPFLATLKPKEFLKKSCHNDLLLSIFNASSTILLKKNYTGSALRSFQNLLILQNLYRQRALGFSFSDPIALNHKNSAALPDSIAALNQSVLECHLCDLSKSRQQSMYGYGNPNADIMIVDAYVSHSENEQNSYYVGRSGLSLKNMVEKVLLQHIDDVYMTHAVKCKPLDSKEPSVSEFESCKAYLFKQIDLIQPKVIIALGAKAYRLITGDTTPFEQVRGERLNFSTFSLVPIYHPTYLLRNPSLKRETLHDLNTIKSLL